MFHDMHGMAQRKALDMRGDCTYMMRLCMLSHAFGLGSGWPSQTDRLNAGNILLLPHRTDSQLGLECNAMYLQA